MNDIVQNAKSDLGERLRCLRLPSTGEFPTVVVFGNGLDNIFIKVEGSEELIRHIKQKFPEDELANVSFEKRRKLMTPKVFLSFGWEDKKLAGDIAAKLMTKGIDTWWAEWEISSGDSLRQKIDEGLGSCSHFLVLLTETSINKPWVKQEMDAGFVKMLEQKCKFIPLRYNLSHSNLPPLLSGQYSPEVDDGLALTQLINDIW